MHAPAQLPAGAHPAKNLHLAADNEDVSPSCKNAADMPHLIGNPWGYLATHTCAAGQNNLHSHGCADLLEVFHTFHLSRQLLCSVLHIQGPI